MACSKGLTIGSHYSMDDMPALDVLLHPGGRGTRPQLNDSRHLEWVRRQRRSVPLMTSVCTGSLVFAAAGPADRASGHHPLGLVGTTQRTRPDGRRAGRRAVRR
ncbi:hypothetical protein [Streptomyces endocoffeicus]|uniref:hypothetical protein n=1 Tax=Streptomyces endocoffeicus TaxID=2898945 RepID=UPI001E4392D2|nr:hypothetical protein [Streptomyces endocoffeicus]